MPVLDPPPTPTPDLLMAAAAIVACSTSPARERIAAVLVAEAHRLTPPEPEPTQEKP